MKKEALNLFLADAHNKQILEILTDLLNQKSVKDITVKHGINRDKVYKVAKKYQIDMGK